MEQDKVSIIIPSYNRFKYLLNAIKSVQNQTYKNIEIIVINDCSTQKEYYTHNFENCKIIHTPINTKYLFGYPCVNYVRNFGVWNSTGKYLAFLDDDDIWFPNKLSLQISAMINTRCELSATDGLIGNGVYDCTKTYKIYNAEHYYNDIVNIYKSKNRFDLIEQGYPDIWTLNFLKVHNCIINSSAVTTRHMFDKLINFALLHSQGEDYNNWLRILEHTNCVYIKDVCFYYDAGHGDGTNL